jgi:hypothetical protein
VLLKKVDGTVALRRTLSGARLCADVTFAAQLILERFARELDVKVAVPTPTPPIPPKPKPAPVPEPLPPPPPPKPEPPAPEPEPIPPPPAPPVVLVAPPAVETKPAMPAPIGRRTRSIRLSRVEVLAGGGGWFMLDYPTRPAFVAELAVFMSESVRFSVELAVAPPQTSSIADIRGQGERGRLSSQPVVAAGTGGYCWAFVVRACAAAVAGAHLESATTEGEYIYQQRNVWLARPAFGLELQGAWLPIAPLTVALSATLLVLPVEAKWEVESLLTQPLPVFEGLLRLSIGFGANR